MTEDEFRRLAQATNSIKKLTVSARDSQNEGDHATAQAHYRDAILQACEAMQAILRPNWQVILEGYQPFQSGNLLGDQAVQFLEAEGQLLKAIGLDQGLVDEVIDGCIDFFGRAPSPISRDALARSLSIAEHLVCGEGVQKARLPLRETNLTTLRIYGRIALKCMVGGTIIVGNWVALGPETPYGQLSIAYGVNWLPTGPG